MSTSIQVSNLGKGYKQYPNQWSRLLEWIIPTNRIRHHVKWILKDINFTVQAGQALGIIGMNGAGKSTLLKIITGTSYQTTGDVQIYGKVAALLELGMGFHPDFTGRQNAIMSGQLMGYSLAEIMDHMENIEDFAEIGTAIDEPVRTYSSGMQVRLAFSVATAIRPDVLIVDEALSVGDAYFQHKSFARIREFREQGTTLLLVSHDKAAIQSICDRAILLKDGVVFKEGKPEEIMDFYNAMIAEKGNETVRQVATESGKIQTISGTGEAEVEEIYLLNGKGNIVEIFDVGESVSLRVKVRINVSIPRLVLGYMIKDSLGQVIYGTNTYLGELTECDVEPGQDLVYDIKFQMNLGPGSYSIATALVSTDTHLANNYEWRDLALIFTVVNLTHTHFAGCVWLESQMEVTRL